MSTVAEYCYVMQIKSDQLIVHNTKKCHTILFHKQRVITSIMAGNNFLIFGNLVSRVSHLIAP